MVRYWGIHNAVLSEEEHSFSQGRIYTYKNVPFDERLRVGDYVYFFRNNDYLYGWGPVHKLGPVEQKAGRVRRDVSVMRSLLQTGLASVSTDILGNPIFANYSRLQDEGLSKFSNEQAQRLNQLCQRGGSSPPDPGDFASDAFAWKPKRPEIKPFVHREKVPIEETRFVEFKKIQSLKPKERILSVVDEYVIGFLNLEDRREEDFCQIFWGIEDDRIVTGVKVNREQRDELRRDVCNRLAKIRPALASSSYYVELHSVIDSSGDRIDDLIVVEVGVGDGMRGEFYCSENDSFYIREDALTRKLTGQSLIAEVTRRERERTKRAIAHRQ